ncbi:hypothetical protein [Rhizobium sp. SL86]|uniref:hypothetical protein n=1 Tax=Rhizobium sp. SL86 TaxID=2995148 RepID=UPI0022759C1A|nr:hypothetical protein [Rhizobium sp. SL86]MCY1668247.1 hypothetical protein [Rhizobium sp. SL86]
MFLDDEEATTRIRLRRKGISLWVAITALAACAVMMLVLVDTAGAAEIRNWSEIVSPQLLLDRTPTPDQRLLYAGLILTFSIAAAGLWRRSFRQALSGEDRARSHGGRISRS